MAMLLLAGATWAAEGPEVSSEPRVSETSEGQGIARGVADTGEVSRDEYEPMIRSGSRSQSTRSSGQQKSSGAETQSGFDDPAD